MAHTRSSPTCQMASARRLLSASNEWVMKDSMITTTQRTGNRHMLRSNTRLIFDFAGKLDLSALFASTDNPEKSLVDTAPKETDKLPADGVSERPKHKAVEGHLNGIYHSLHLTSDHVSISAVFQCQATSHWKKPFVPISSMIDHVDSTYDPECCVSKHTDCGPFWRLSRVVNCYDPVLPVSLG